MPGPRPSDWLALLPTITAFCIGLLTHRLPAVPSVQLTVRGMSQVPTSALPGMSCHVPCCQLTTGTAWHESLSKPSSSEGSGVAAAHSSNSARGLGRVFQETRGLFSEKNVTAGIYQGSLLPGAVLSTICVFVHLSCPFTAEGRAIITLLILIFQVNCVLRPGPHAY